MNRSHAHLLYEIQALSYKGFHQDCWSKASHHDMSHHLLKTQLLAENAIFQNSATKCIHCMQRQNTSYTIQTALTVFAEEEKIAWRVILGSTSLWFNLIYGTSKNMYYL